MQIVLIAKYIHMNLIWIKHYKDGEFHKDYDRSVTVNSMTNFLRDPAGDLQWEERLLTQ